ncbi:uncharacterized protein G2W53_035432 [Senna tora]|uniref:Uncharacterized protein n=1 Tax=Senna tora TaxID=362788 RepID=A0A834SRR0_9FABA|nr:uncharacterized protein G2W53_035432 [Senna tora]
MAPAHGPVFDRWHLVVVVVGGGGKKEVEVEAWERKGVNV